MEPKRWKAYPKYFPYKLKGRYKKVFPDVTEETKINLLPLNINQDNQSKYISFSLHDSGLFIILSFCYFVLVHRVGKC